MRTRTLYLITFIFDFLLAIASGLYNIVVIGWLLDENALGGTVDIALLMTLLFTYAVVHLFAGIFFAIGFGEKTRSGRPFVAMTCLGFIPIMLLFPLFSLASQNGSVLGLVLGGVIILACIWELVSLIWKIHLDKSGKERQKIMITVTKET